jgi:UDP-galactopyranose mutase
MNNKKILVIGAGISGCVAARLLAEEGYIVDIIEKRNHVAGNCYDYYTEDGILIHKYGPHLFHTNNEDVFNFLSNFTKWIKYEHKVKALYDNKYLTLPVNKETKEIVGEEKCFRYIFQTIY